MERFTKVTRTSDIKLFFKWFYRNNLAIDPQNFKLSKYGNVSKKLRDNNFFFIFFLVVQHLLFNFDVQIKYKETIPRDSPKISPHTEVKLGFILLRVTTQLRIPFPTLQRMR